MKNPRTKTLFVILIILNLGVLPLLTNAVSDILPFKDLSPRGQTILFFVWAVAVSCAAVGVYLFDRNSTNPEAIEASANVWGKHFRNRFARVKQGLYRWWEKFIKLISMWHTTIQQAGRGRVRYVLFFAGAFMLLLWFIARIVNNSDWDQPRDIAQVDWLDTAIGWNRNELAIKLSHFGAEASNDPEPYTVLTRAGFGDSLLTMREFRQYIKIAPDTLPRNNLSVTLSPAHSSLNLKNSFEILAHAHRVKKISAHPTVYALELYAKTSGNQQPFMRRYNFRERTTFEVITFVLGCVLMAFSIALFLEIPKMFGRTSAYDRLSGFFKSISLIALRAIKIAVLLKLQIAKSLEDLTEIINRVIKIFEEYDKDRKPEIAPLLRTQLDLIKKEFGQEGTAILNQETAAKLEQRVVAMFRIVEIIDHVVIIVQDDREGCQKLLNATASAVSQSRERGDELAEEYNARIRSYRETHEQEKNEVLAGIRDNVGKMFRSEKFKVLFDDFINQRGRYLREEPEFIARDLKGKGYHSLVVDIPLMNRENRLLPLGVRRKDGNIVFAAMGMFTVLIPAPTLNQPDGKLEYKLRFENLTLAPPYTLPENMADLTSLEPVNPNDLELLYKEKTLDEFEI